MHTTRSIIRSFTLILFFATTFVSADQPKSSRQQEADYLAVLRSDAAEQDKAIACKHLSIHGSDESVAELAKLLSNARLSSWARIALEAIPGTAADQALREASQSLEGQLLVGTINSIGVRRDAAAVDSLATRLQDKDAEVASAAAVALGRIGNDAATKSLQAALAAAPDQVRNAVAEGYLLCAEGLHNAGNSEAAATIYDEIRQSEVPMQRVIEATRGAILARGEAGIPLLLETLQSSEKKLFQLALGTAREFPRKEVDKALAAELGRAAPERAALIVQAMADRPDTVDLAAVMQAAETGDTLVRLSAIDALRRIGDSSCLSGLLATAISDDADLAQAAKATLAGIPGEQIDAKIVSMLPEAKGKSYPLLIELIGQRRIDAVPDLLKALNHADQAVRHAALVALGETVPLDRLSLLVTQVVSPKHPEDAAVAGQALKAASIRMPDREACATELAMALQKSPAATKTSLLEILTDVGGAKALETLASAAKSDDPDLQDNGSRLLGKWNGVDAAPVLLDLAKTSTAEKYQVRALRGYIGIARKFAMPDPQRAEMCKQALDTAKRSDEKKLVLEVLQLHPSRPGLELAINAKKLPEVKNEAAAATTAIAKKLSDKGVDVSDLLAADK
jgi:HEAT repeat protein